MGKYWNLYSLHYYVSIFSYSQTREYANLLPHIVINVIHDILVSRSQLSMMYRVSFHDNYFLLGKGLNVLRCFYVIVISTFHLRIIHPARNKTRLIVSYSRSFIYFIYNLF